MTTPFFQPLDDFKAALGAPYVAGSGTLTLAAGAGAALGTLAAGRFFRVVAVRGSGTATEAILGVFVASGLDGDSLTGVAADAGHADADIPSATGVTVEVRDCARGWADLQDAANAAEATLAGLGTAATHAAADFDLAGAAATVAVGLSAHQADHANPHAVTRAQVGLGGVDNTADAAKPVSAAQQAALDLKAPLASPALTGTPSAPTAAPGTNTTQLATTAFVLANAPAGGVSSVAGRTGAVTLSTADLTTPLSGLVKAAANVLTAATAGTDYVAPAGSGAALTGITASQVGSVPAGLLKGAIGAFAAAVAGTDFLAPAGDGSGLTNLSPSALASPVPLAKGGTAAADAPTARTNLQVGADLAAALGLDPTALTAPQLAALAAARVAPAASLAHDFALANGATYAASNVTTSVPAVGSYTNETSVYSGWAFPVGPRQNFNRVELKLRSYDPANPITKVRIRVLTPDYAGTLLADRTYVLDPALPFNVSTTVAFDLDQPVLNAAGSPLWLEFQTDGRSGLLLGTTTPYNDTFTRCRYANNSSVTALSSNNYSSGQLNGWAQFSLVDPTADRLQGPGGAKAFIQSAAANLYKPTLALPSMIYSVVGHEMNVYHDNICRSFLSTDHFEVRVTSAVGTALDRRYTYTPVVGDVGDKAWSIAFNFGGSTLATASPTLRVRAAKATAVVNRKLIAVGDSVTIAGAWLAELLNLCNYNCTSPTPGGGADNLTLTLIGTKTVTVADAGGTSRTVNCEAVSGKTIDYFYTDPASPFVFSGVFSFSQYLTANSITLGSGDWVLFHLGINSLSGVTSDATFNTAVATMKTEQDAVIANIRAAVPGIRIGLMMTIPPSFHQDAAGASYGVSNPYRARHKRNIDLWHEAMISYYGSLTGSNQWLVPVHAGLDTVNNMSFNTVAVNARNATTEPRQSNLVHPADSGQYQIGDQVYYFLRGQES